MFVHSPTSYNAIYALNATWRCVETLVRCITGTENSQKLRGSLRERTTLIARSEEWDFHAIQREVLVGLFRKSVWDSREKLSEERRKDELNEG